MSFVKSFIMMCYSCAVVGLSFSSPKTVQIRDFTAANCDENLVFVVSFCKPLCTFSRWDLFCHFSDWLFRLSIQVGAMAHGKIDADYIDDLISGCSKQFCSFQIQVLNCSYNALPYCIWERMKFVWLTYHSWYFDKIQVGLRHSYHMHNFANYWASGRISSLAAMEF